MQPRTENSIQPTQGEPYPIASMQSPPRKMISPANVLKGADMRIVIQEEDQQGRGLPDNLYSGVAGDERQQIAGETYLAFEEMRSSPRRTLGDISERRNGEGLNEGTGAINWLEETAEMRLRRLQRPNPKKGGSPDASPGWYEEATHEGNQIPLHETCILSKTITSGKAMALETEPQHSWA